MQNGTLLDNIAPRHHISSLRRVYEIRSRNQIIDKLNLNLGRIGVVWINGSLNC